MLTLVKLTKENYPLLVDMMDEWTAAESRIVPHSIVKADYRTFESYRDSLEIQIPDADHVPDTTYFCLDTDRNRFVGAVNIRHYLNESLLRTGGHVGDGVRPSERRKGTGTKMVGLALEKCREMGITRVLMVCDKTNIASAKTIQYNGGVLENELHVDGIVEQRYWIALA